MAPILETPTVTAGYQTHMTCGCFGALLCERHQQMRAELDRRYSAKSSTARENASNSGSASFQPAGIVGPR